MGATYNPPNSFNPASPGPIGGTTPDLITVTEVNLASGLAQVNPDGTIQFTNLTSTSGLYVFNNDGSCQLGNGVLAGDGQGNLQTSEIIILGGINAANLPASDPHVSGEFWSNLGIVTSSNG